MGFRFHFKTDGTITKNVHHNFIVRHGIPSGPNQIGCGFIYQQERDTKDSWKQHRDYLTKEKESGELELLEQESY